MSLLKKLRNQKLQKAVAVSVLALGFGISNDVSAYKNPYSDNAVYTGNSTVVVGSEAEALEKAGATAVGYQASASNSGTAVGAYSNASQDGTAVGYRANASGTDSIAIGDTVNNATAIMSIALGFDSDATEVGAIVLGARSSATAEDAIAIGKDTEANYNSAIAVGADSFANAAGSVVIGTNAGISSSGVSSVAVGGFSRAYGTHSLALGSGADSSADYSVAIGSNSEASEAYTVSFGSGETKRRLVNVAAGTAQTDAVNVSQLISKGSYNAETKQLSLQSNSGSNVLVDLSALPEGGAAYTAGDGIIIADDVISVKKDGTVTEGNTDVVTGGTVYDAVKNKADITYIDAELANKADTDLGNITDGGKGVVGDIAEEALADDLNAKANVNASNVAGFTAEWGAAIGTGIVEDGNRQLVTGGTVFNAVKDKADITYVDNGLLAKADADLGNLTAGGQTVIQNIAISSVKLANGTNTTVSSSENEDGSLTYKVNVEGSGQAEAGNTGLVSGDTLYNTVNEINENITNVTEGINADLNNKANTDASNVAEHTAEWGKAIGTGVIEDGNGQLVSGGTVFNAVKDKADITYVDAGLSNKVDLGLGNINIDGRNVIQNIAKGSVKLANGTNTTVSSSENEDGSLTYKVHVEGSGQAEAGNTGLVSGDTLYNTVNNISNNFTEITDDINAELAVKANADASNVAGFTAEWGAAIGTGIIEDGNGQLVTGGTVFNAVKDKADITYVDNGLLSKADADLGNLTAGGQSVIQNIAKGSVKLENGINTTVSSTENEDGSLTYKVNVEGSGKAEAGNTGLVSGDTLYNTVNEINENITNVTEGINADLNNKADANASNVADHTAEWGAAIGTGLVEDGNSELVTDDTVYEAVKDKADADLGNLTEDGKDVIKNIAQNSVKVEDGLNTTVTRTENEDGSLTYKVNVEGSGKAEAGNTGLISGDTLYNTVNEINENITNVTEGINAELDGKADADASNVADHTAEWGAAIGTGKVEAGNGELVTGNTVYEAVKDKADADFGNLTEDGKGVIGDIAQDALQDDLDGKANTDASNIETDKWADKLGTGTIADGDKSLVNGDTVYDAIKNMGGGLVMSDDKTITVGKNDGAAVIDVARQNSDGSTENRVITGVQTDSEDMSSAANVGYVNQSVGQLASDFNRGLSELDNQMKKGVAGAAAIAALNPLDYDPENKLNFAAGVGSYKGENATALGMFYRPNENVMFSLGGAFGNGENMWNAGITFNLDKPSTSTSKAAMARAIKTMAADNDALEAKAAEQDAKIAQLTAQVQALLEAQGINK
jgi:hypothetical protein